MLTKIKPILETPEGPEEKIKSASFIDIMKELQTTQRPWNQLEERVQKAYNQFMLNRFYSCNARFINYLELISRYTLTDRDHYEFLRAITFPQFYQLDYKETYKKKIAQPPDADLCIYALKNQYKIGNKDAADYYENLMDPKHIGGKEELEKLKKKWKSHYEAFGKVSAKTNK